jgi:hypothetical protein
LPLAAQDGFGFDDEESGGASGGSGALAVSIGGEVSAAMTAYIDGFADGPETVRLGMFFPANSIFPPKLPAPPALST